MEENWGVKVGRIHIAPLLKRPNESGMVGSVLKIIDQKSYENTLIKITLAQEDQMEWEIHDWEKNILSNGMKVYTKTTNCQSLFIITRRKQIMLRDINENDIVETCWSAIMGERKYKICVYDIA
jgi:hypothetical protein